MAVAATAVEAGTAGAINALRQRKKPGILICRAGIF